jgi:hypothetical protein
MSWFGLTAPFQTAALGFGHRDVVTISFRRVIKSPSKFGPRWNERQTMKDGRPQQFGDFSHLGSTFPITDAIHAAMIY